MQYREICDLSNDEIKDVINRVILKNSNPNEEEHHLIKNIYGIKRRKRTKDIVLKVDIEWHYIDIFMQKPVSEIETEVMILNDEEIITEDFCFFGRRE